MPIAMSKRHKIRSDASPITLHATKKKKMSSDLETPVHWKLLGYNGQSVTLANTRAFVSEKTVFTTCGKDTCCRGRGTTGDNDNCIVLKSTGILATVYVFFYRRRRRGHRLLSPRPFFLS